MMLTQFKSSLQEFLSNWFYVWLIAVGFFAMESLFGWKACVALKHNVGLNEVVTWYGRGNGNIIQYYLSTLIIFSILWFLGGVGLILAGWIYNRSRPASGQQTDMTHHQVE